jgi:hypothetical protein
VCRCSTRGGASGRVDECGLGRVGVVAGVAIAGLMAWRLLAG